MNTNRKNINESDSLSDLARIIITTTMKNISSMTLARIAKIELPFDYSKGFGTCYVAPFPLEEGQSPYNLLVYFFSDIAFRENEIVTIGFTDYSFIDNLLSQKIEPLETTNKNMHSKAFGIILNPTYRPRIMDHEPDSSTPGYDGDVIFVIQNN